MGSLAQFPAIQSKLSFTGIVGAIRKFDFQLNVAKRRVESACLPTVHVSAFAGEVLEGCLPGVRAVPCERQGALSLRKYEFFWRRDALSQY